MLSGSPMGTFWCVKMKNWLEIICNQLIYNFVLFTPRIYNESTNKVHIPLMCCFWIGTSLLWKKKSNHLHKTGSLEISYQHPILFFLLLESPPPPPPHLSFFLIHSCFRHVVLSYRRLLTKNVHVPSYGSRKSRKKKRNYKTDKQFSQTFSAKKVLEKHFKTQKMFIPLIANITYEQFAFTFTRYWPQFFFPL